MLDDRDREILAETERRLRREDPGLARRFGEKSPSPPRRLALVATSIPALLLLLLLLVGSMILGLGLFTFALAGLAAASIWFRVRREGND